jgi:hypothetical protein
VAPNLYPVSTGVVKQTKPVFFSLDDELTHFVFLNLNGLCQSENTPPQGTAIHSLMSQSIPVTSCPPQVVPEKTGSKGDAFWSGWP